MKRSQSYTLRWLCLAILFVSSTVLAQPLSVQRLENVKKVPVYFHTADGLPIVDIRVLVHAGSAYDGAHPGLAALTSQLLDQGTARHSDKAIANQFAKVGARYSHSVDNDWASYSLRSVTNTKQLQAALKLFTEVLTQPRFTQDALARQKANVLVGIKLAQQDPQTIAMQTFMQQLYGQHPYGHPVEGTSASVSQTTLSDVQKFYQRFYGHENVRIVIVGELSSEQAKMISDQIVSAFPSTKPAATLNAPKMLNQTKTMQVAFDGSQNNIILGALGVTRHDANYFPLVMGNLILGGDGLISRLFDQVREAKGLAYVVQSYFIPLQVSGPWLMFLQTRAEMSQQAVQTSQNTFDQFLKNGPSVEEVQKAKDYLIDSFSVRFASNADKADALTLIAAYDLPLDYFSTYDEKVNAVSKEQIQSAFKQLFSKQGLLTIIVGKHGSKE